MFYDDMWEGVAGNGASIPRLLKAYFKSFYPLPPCEAIEAMRSTTLRSCGQREKHPVGVWSTSYTTIRFLRRE